MLQIGDNFKHDFSYTQEDVDTYARVSGDVNPLHIDEAAGKPNLCLAGASFTAFLGASVFHQNIWCALVQTMVMYT